MSNRCPLCPNKFNCISPDGPTDSEIMFVGEAPGYQENKSGVPFIGSTGRELNEHYLPLAGLKRGEIYITNAIRCFPDRPKGKLDLNREKDKELLKSCSEFHLLAEIDRVKPKLIVPMGAFACYALDQDISLDLHHGIPINSGIGTLFPFWHPSGGVHEPKKILQLRNDWIRLRRYLRGGLNVPIDNFGCPDYRECTSSDISDIDPTVSMAADTESSKFKGPYCLTYSQQPGYGRLIRSEDTKLLQAFQRKIDKWESYVYFHNWPYDWTVTEDMGLSFPTKLSIAESMGVKFTAPITRDTMMMVYHLGNLPQGLKTLAFRLLGMVMEDFEDLVKPYSAGRVYDYYRLAQTFEWPKPEEQLIKNKNGKWKVYKAQSLNTKLKSLFTNLGKNSEKDIFKVWDTWEVHQTEIEEKCGPYYGLDIADVPFEDVIHYACRDADATIRLVPILLKMRGIAMTGKLQEVWDAG